jgi:voltage-dependent calcium channel T type alpha-1G
LVSRSDSLKIAINALVLSLPKLGNLFLVSLVFYVMYGVLGTNIFKGAYYSCNISTVGNYTIIGKLDCLDYGGSWSNADYNFDDIFNAVNALFVLSTTEGWLD